MGDTIKAMTEAVRGRVITPSDSDYDDARAVYNGMHDRNPRAVIRLKNVWVDPVKKVVRVGGGATWGDVDHATYPFGLAAPDGIISTTGVGGLTLGGGLS